MHYLAIEHLITDISEKEELKTRLELISESDTKFHRHILDDVITIHINYGLNIQPDYFFNLHKESRGKKFLKKLFPKSKYILRRVHLMLHSYDGDFIKVEYLKGIENLSSGFKPNWIEIEEEFTSGEFNIDNHPNLTLTHESYYYDDQDMILDYYEKRHVIDSPQMRKEISHLIKREGSENHLNTY